MRFKDFLQEDTNTFEEILEKIKADCQPFLKEARYPVWRGMNGVKSGMLISHPTDRAPRDSKPYMNMLLNAGIELAFGVRDIRQNCFFGTGDASSVTVYGTPYLIFPRGEFKFIWSPTISDPVDSTKLWRKLALTLKRHKLFNLDDYHIDPSATIPYTVVRELMAKFEDIYSEYGSAGAFIEEGDKELLKAIKESFEELYGVGELDDAIFSQHEIMFYKSNGYYLLSPEQINIAYEIENGKKLDWKDGELYDFVRNKTLK